MRTLEPDVERAEQDAVGEPWSPSQLMVSNQAIADVEELQTFPAGIDLSDEEEGENEESGAEDDAGYEPHDVLPPHFKQKRGTFFHFRASVEQKEDKELPISFCQGSGFKQEVSEVVPTDTFTVPPSDAWCKKCIRPLGSANAIRRAAGE